MAKVNDTPFGDMITTQDLTRGSAEAAAHIAIEQSGQKVGKIEVSNNKHFGKNSVKSKEFVSPAPNLKTKK